jgi:hypothetical protein
MSGHSRICYIENGMGANKIVASSSQQPTNLGVPGVLMFLRKLQSP